MAQKGNRKVYSNNNSTYIYGNAVRKLAVTEPAVRPQRKRDKQSEEEKRQELLRRQELQKIHRMNVLYTVAVVCVVAFIFAVCIQYLELQSSVKKDAASVADMEQQLSELLLQNDEDEVKINGNIDYDAILDTAVSELGMVYPSRNQEINYNSGESEYVKQFQDIPSGN